MRIVSAHLLFVAAVAAFGAAHVGAQCPSWSSQFAHRAGTSGQVRAFAAFDTGSGPRLYVGGYNMIAATGSTPQFILQFDGAQWLSVGGGTSGPVRALQTFDDGTGPALYVAGEFSLAGGIGVNAIGRWNGTNWSTLGTAMNGWVNALIVFDDGSGPALYAAGRFTTANGVTVNHVAKWNGSTWSALGEGLNADANALAVYDDGSGPALYVCGDFTGGGSMALAHVAKWNGTTWVPLGIGINNTGPSFTAYAMAAYDDGTGQALYVGGDFFQAGGVDARGIARWNGTTWSNVGGSLTSGYEVLGLAVYDDGTGRKLYASGDFPSVGGVPAQNIAQWNGSTWSSLASGLSPQTAWSLGVFDDGVTHVLCAGGDFDDAGGVHVDSIARWNGSSWSSIGVGQGLNSFIYGMCTHDDGSGPALYVAGDFTVAGTQSASHIARWNGSAWSTLGSGLSGGWSDLGIAYTLTSFDDGTGPALYAGGSFTTAGSVAVNNVARWNGASWSALGAGLPGSYSDAHPVEALCVFDDGTGPALYAGGEFSIADGAAADHIAKWDGTAWSAVGAGMDDTVRALTVFDDGTGPALYAGGDFKLVGGVSAEFVARWNGSTWTALAGGTSLGYNGVRAFTIFDDGNGRALYASGGFWRLDGTTAYDIAKWNGSTWSTLGSGFDRDGVTLCTFDDGTGRGASLIAGGDFTLAGGVSVSGLARWNGSSWSSVAEVGAGTYEADVGALAVLDDGFGHRTLFAGGDIGSIDGTPSRFIAARSACNEVGRTYCFGDGSGTLCPCGNASASGDRDGCVNSTGNAGRLRASGTPRIAHDTLRLDGSQMNSGTALYFQGTTRVNGGNGNVFGDGLRCAGGSIVRMEILANAGGASHVPRVSDPSISVGGHVITPGRRTYQIWYRDAQSYCTPSTFDLTNAVEITWEL